MCYAKIRSTAKQRVKEINDTKWSARANAILASE
jgi:hypothetical protein